MEEGLSPIGYDGKSINIHHIDQTNGGPVMEISVSSHQYRLTGMCLIDGEMNIGNGGQKILNDNLGG